MFLFNKLSLLTAAVCAVMPAFGQLSLSGKIVDSENRLPVSRATIEIDQSYTVLYSGTDGTYNIRKLSPGTHYLTVSSKGFKTKTDTVDLQTSQTIDIVLDKEVVLLDEVLVSSTRADIHSAMAYSVIDKKALEKQNLGQDLPYLLNQLPSVVTTSDAGAGVGYTGLRIRGSDASRVNVTINGVPVNDAESQGTYWVDLPDIVSSIDNIQVQRGVGSSSNGAGAFGGSLNIETSKLQLKPYGIYDGSAGSFSTYKTTIQAGTGLMNEHVAFDLRLSKLNSQGFIDKASSDLGSYYFSGAYYGKKSLLKFITFSGQEETYQAWNGVPESRLKGDIAGMEDYIIRNGLDAEDSAHLINSGSRTYNQFTYKNQVDHYRQDYYQLHFSQTVSSTFNITASLHYTKGKGYYEEYRKQDSFSDYGLPDVVIGTDTIGQTNLIRRRWLDNNFYGIIFSGNYSNHRNFSASIGGSANRYDGLHYGEIIWAQYASTSQLYDTYYKDTASKTDVCVYAKGNFSISSKLSVYADLQYRQVNYSFLGYDDSLRNIQQTASLGFINPKIGINYQFNQLTNAFLSYSKGGKEPGRDDYTQSSPQSRPKAEHLDDIEAGFQFDSKKFRTAITLYNMSYKDQLVLTGEINDVGAYNRTNVDKSYRRGIEFEFGWKLLRTLQWTGNITLSENKISDFQEYIDNYDSTAQRVIDHGTTDIAFSPSVIGKSMIEFVPVKGLSFSLISSYVGNQYLDNTTNKDRQLDAYFLNDLRIAYNFKTKWIREIGVNITIYNLFNTEYESNGYTYGYIYGGTQTVENFYYPQAGVNFLAGIHIKF